MLRAERLAVVGMTKTDLRAALADASVDPQTLFDITDVIGDDILDLCKDQITQEVHAGCGCVDERRSTGRASFWDEAAAKS